MDGPSLLELPARKIQVSIRLDADIVTYFKTFGPRYQTRINQVLKAFMREQHQRPKPRRK
jgi:uncharacterized protein (DUF4415 family)